MKSYIATFERKGQIISEGIFKADTLKEAKRHASFHKRQNIKLKQSKVSIKLSK